MFAEQPGSNRPDWDATEETLPVRSPRVKAECPVNPSHHAVVYRTDGRVRYCKCNDCGEYWKQGGPEA